MSGLRSAGCTGLRACRSRRSPGSWGSRRTRCAGRCGPGRGLAGGLGWGVSIRGLRGKVGELRPLYLPQDPAGRTAYEPGGLVQDDFWFPPAEVPLGHGKVATGDEVPPVLVMASGYSRWMLGSEEHTSELQ